MSDKKKVSLDEFMGVVASKPIRRAIKYGSVSSGGVGVKKKRIPMKRSPTIIVKKTPTQEEMNEWLSTKPGFIEGLTETDYNPTTLYQYQIDYLNDPNPFKHIDKARQTGYSFVFSAEGLAEAHLMDKHTEIFISINQEEANEKVVYARELYESMPLGYQKKLVVENKKCLEFESVTGHKRGRTRIISHAQREPRGKGGNTKVVLDEAAHYQFGEKIYTAAMPIISRGYGGITIASTPLGKSGIHWTVMAEEEYRNLYSYFTVYWWNCPEFVRPGKFKEAQLVCPSLPTAERVQKYGSQKIRHIFIGMDIESFQQEYECHHIDESVSYIPMSLINRCVYRVQVDDIFDEPDENATDEILKTAIEEKHPGIAFRFYDNIDDMLSAMQAGIIKGRLIGGFDVGRKHHTAELLLIEEANDKLNIVRLRRSYRNEPFEVMKEEIGYAVRNGHIRKLGIDATGPGIQLAEEMRQSFPGVCEEVNFTGSWKDESASNVRRFLESQWLAIPDDRDFKKQFHSIKRMVTDHGNLRIDAEKNKDHHGDVFWATALASMYIRNRPRINYSIKLKDEAGKKNDSMSPVKIARPNRRIFIPNSPIVQPILRPSGSNINFGLKFPLMGRMARNG